MDTIPSLGLFSKLPYEIREQIWLHFLPKGRDTVFLNSRNKTDLRILRASKDLYYEVSRLIYRQSTLEFDIVPIYGYSVCEEHWTTVRFTQKASQYYYEQQDKCQVDDRRARWILKDKSDGLKRGFDNIPFHRIDDVIVNLFPSRTWDPAKLFMLYQQIDDLCELFRMGQVIAKLTIRLCNRNGQDWVNENGPNRSFTSRESKGRLDHDIVVMPFCALCNVEAITIEPQSDELKSKMNWSVINWALQSRHGDEETQRTFLRTAALEYIWVHNELWFYTTGQNADFMRWRFFLGYFYQTYSGGSQFEQRILRICDEFPEIAAQGERDIELNGLMLHNLVRFYLFIREDPEEVRIIFQYGIPSGSSDLYERIFLILEDFCGTKFPGTDINMVSLVYSVRKQMFERLESGSC